MLVGFAAETDDLVEQRGRQAARPSGSTSSSATTSPQPDAGFEVDTNRAVILDAGGGTDTLPLLAKSELAGVILDRVARLLDTKRRSQRASETA